MIILIDCPTCKTSAQLFTERQYSIGKEHDRNFFIHHCPKCKTLITIDTFSYHVPNVKSYKGKE